MISAKIKKAIQKKATAPLKDLLQKARIRNILATYKNRFSVEIDNRKYLIKTASNGKELKSALKLRHEVFYQELLSRNSSSGLDVDKFDPVCDHIIVIDKKTNKCVGTYRLNTNRGGIGFYSSSEFKMDSIISSPGQKVELGRACIHPDHRTGPVFILIWKAIMKYCISAGATHMFGCSSIKTTDFIEAGIIHRELMQEYAADDRYLCKPQADFCFNNFESFSEYLASNPECCAEIDTNALIPSLLKFYMRSGARICGEPALDRDFKCIDFLTLVDIDGLSDSFKRKFSV